MLFITQIRWIIFLVSFSLVVGAVCYFRGGAFGFISGCFGIVGGGWRWTVLVGIRVRAGLFCFVGLLCGFGIRIFFILLSLVGLLGSRISISLSKCSCYVVQSTTVLITMPILTSVIA